MSKYLLINEPPLTVSPTLAKIIGLDEAVVIQQVHYWLMNPKNEGRTENGEKWVYNTYEEWQEGNFPFWSVDKIQRIFLKLEKQGLIISRQFDAKSRNMRKFYRLAYDEICVLHDSVLPPSIDAKLHDVKMNQRLPETNESDSLKTNEVQGSYNAVIEKADKTVDAILAAEALAKQAESEGKAWRGREFLVGSEYCQYGDWWHGKTGLEMYGKGKAKIDAEWLKAFKEWAEFGVTIDALNEAYEAEKWRTISKPSQLTGTAKAIQAAGGVVKNTTPVKTDNTGMVESW